MSIKIYDLSLSLENYASEPYPPQVFQTDHVAGARRLGKLAGLEPSDFPDGMGLATEQVTASTHSGTHIDAPWHYGPTSEGKPALTVDKLPLEYFYGDGVVLDVRHKEPGSEITVKDLEEALAKINYTLKPRDIVLLNTGADKYWGTSNYNVLYAGLGEEGTAWLVEKGVKLIGIDAWGLDIPVKYMAENLKKTGDKSKLWAAHFYGRKKEYFQIEKLANLDKLPKPYGFKVSALPVKVANGTAGWCRAVAIFEE